MKFIKILSMVLFFILIINSYRTTAIPPIASEFYGTIQVDLIDAPVGANVTMYDADNVLCGSFAVSVTGYYGILSCNGDDTGTASDEGAVSGDNLTFYINGNLSGTIGNTTWIEGRYSNVNLSITGINVNFAPTFDQALTSKNVSRGLTFDYDVNCSDANANDTVTYYDNTSQFNISSTTGIISWLTSSDDVGDNAILITCSDGTLNTTGILTIVVQEKAPTFDHILTTQNVNETSTFDYDVNCSDVNPGDTLTYYDNTSQFNIGSTTGIISWIPVNADVGDNPILIICSDGSLNTTGVLTITVSDINNPPTLESIGNQIAVEGESFALIIDATDADNDTLTYYANTTLFTINQTTGIINFTPNITQIGNYSINITVNDSLLTDHEVISFKIVRGPYCGDGSCGSTEECTSCASDCGSCPSVPGADPGAGAGAGGKAAAVAGRRITRVCQERWECADWSICSIDSFQSRKCIDINKCGTKKKKPSELQTCTYIPTCLDGIRNGIETGVDCGGPCKDCIIPMSCSDGIQNQGEEALDCGGPCEPCELKKYAKLPIPKLAPLAKKFPWLLFLIVSILISSTILSDKLYVRKITKKEFEEYRKKIRKYKKIRIKIWILSGVLALLGIAYLLYMYIMSDKPELVENFIWIPTVLVVIILIPAFFILKHFKHYEYKERKKEELFFLEHKKRKKDLIKMEEKMLISLELKIINRTDSLLEQNIITEEDILNRIMDINNILKDLIKERKLIEKSITTTDEIKTAILNISDNSNLIDLASDYPEFKDVLNALKGLKNQVMPKNTKTQKKSKKEGKNEMEKIEIFLLSVAMVSQDKHLKSVIRSSMVLIELYNQVVEVYEYYKDQLDRKENGEENLIEKESAYSSKIEQLTNKPEIIEPIKANAKYASLYNSLVDLYNHYKKRKEIHNEIKSMEKS